MTIHRRSHIYPRILALFVVALFLRATVAHAALTETPSPSDSYTYGKATTGLRIFAYLPYQHSKMGPTMLETLVYIDSTNSEPVYGYAFPPVEYRFDLSLRDSSGKSVSRTMAGDAICRPVSDPVLSRIGRTRNALVFFPNRKFYVGKNFMLTEYFKITKPGIYNMTVGLRLYKIAKGDADATPAELPAVTIPITVKDSEL